MSATDLQFKAFIDRILRCREAEDAAKEDTKAVYAEMKAEGYDKTAAGALVAEKRKQDKNPDKFNEASAILDLYREAYERASGTGLATHTYGREAADVSAKLVETVAKGMQTEIGRKALVTALDIMIEREESAEFPSRVAAVNGSPEPTDHAVRAGDESTAPHSHSSLPISSQAETKAEAAPILPSASATPFILKTQPMRPHCLNREVCAGQGYEHCHRCTKAMEDSEAA